MFSRANFRMKIWTFDTCSLGEGEAWSQMPATFFGSNTFRVFSSFSICWMASGIVPSCENTKSTGTVTMSPGPQFFPLFSDKIFSASVLPIDVHLRLVSANARTDFIKFMHIGHGWT